MNIINSLNHCQKPNRNPNLYETNITVPHNIGVFSGFTRTISTYTGYRSYLNGTYIIKFSTYYKDKIAYNVFTNYGIINASSNYWWGGLNGISYCTLYGGGVLDNYKEPYRYPSYVYVESPGYLFNTIYNTNQNVNGEYVQFSLPYYLLPKSFRLISSPSNVGRSNNLSPNGYCLLGSSDSGLTWTLLYMANPPEVGSTTTAINSVTNVGTIINVSTTTTFNAFRMVITSIVGTGLLSDKQETFRLSYMGVTGDSYKYS